MVAPRRDQPTHAIDVQDRNGSVVEQIPGLDGNLVRWASAAAEVASFVAEFEGGDHSESRALGAPNHLDRSHLRELRLELVEGPVPVMSEMDRIVGIESTTRNSSREPNTPTDPAVVGEPLLQILDGLENRERLLQSNQPTSRRRVPPFNRRSHRVQMPRRESDHSIVSPESTKGDGHVIDLVVQDHAGGPSRDAVIVIVVRCHRDDSSRCSAQRAGFTKVFERKPFDRTAKAEVDPTGGQQ